MRRLLASFVMLVALTVSACGTRGPLYLPPPPKPTSAPKTTPATPSVPVSPAADPVADPTTAPDSKK